MNIDYHMRRWRLILAAAMLAAVSAMFYAFRARAATLIMRAPPCRVDLPLRCRYAHMLLLCCCHAMLPMMPLRYAFDACCC